MERLKLDLLGFDAGFACSSPDAFADKVAELVEGSWDGGADVVLLPELLWMGLERFVEEENAIRNVAAVFQQQLWPMLRDRLSRSGKAVVLGTTPFADESGVLRNRAMILADGRVIHQDKLHLTPWERAFTGGGPLRVWEFKGARMAVVICLDIEIPEISAALRGHAVDLLLVPSATETLMGVERVSRCADARAVELGCHVGLCHLSGNAESGLIDVNLGRLAAFSPSQAAFADHPRRTETAVFTEGFHRLGVELDIGAIRRQRASHEETDPSKVIAAMPEIRILRTATMHTLIKTYYETFNSGDREALLALLHPEVVHEINEGGVETGIAAFREFLMRMDRCYRETVEDLVVFGSDDPARAAAEFHIRGEYLSTDDGLPEATGQTYHLRVGAFFGISDGLISRVSNHYNLAAWLRMVGGSDQV
jgi:steroid delta-isomerase-like uncharacterized protein